MDQKSKNAIDDGSNIHARPVQPTKVNETDAMSESEDQIRLRNIQKLQNKGKKKNHTKLS